MPSTRIPGVFPATFERSRPVIYRSDIVIMLLSLGVLALGLWNWQQNIDAQHRARQAAPQAMTPVDEPGDNDAVTSRVDALESDTRPILSSDGQEESPSGGSDDLASIGDTTVPAVTELRDNVNTNTLSRVDAAAPDVVSVDETQTADAEGFGVHRVVYGDYLARIADQYGTSVEVLQRLNGIEGTLIQVGQEIRYPQ